MKRILILFLFSFTIVVFGRCPALASCDFFQSTAPTCDATTVGLMWCDTGTPGSATNPILKACDDVTGTWNQVQLTTRNLDTTFNSNITISGTRTLDAGSNKWTMVADPTAAQDAATKAYVDSVVAFIFGDGSDGACSYTTGTTTLTMDLNCTTLTIDGSSTIINPDGYKIFANMSCTLGNGAKIRRNGNNGTAGSNATGDTGGAGGAGGSALAAGSLPGALAGGGGGTGGMLGGGGMAGTAGGNATTLGGGGAAGGDGGSGGTCGPQNGGAAGTSIASGNQMRDLIGGLTWFDPISSTVIYSRTGNGGGGGGDCGSSNGGGGGGGGAGTNGGNILFACRDISVTGTFTIEAIGGNGAAGGNGGGTNGNGGGGGGAGSGGIATVVYNKLSGSITANVGVGTAGAGGTGGTGGMSGGTGSAGIVRTITGP